MSYSPLDIYNYIRNLGMNQKDKANQLVKEYVLWSAGAGLLPIPLLDVAAVTAVQVKLLRKLCEMFEVSYDENSSRALLSSLLSSVTASAGASMLKAIPIIGSALGGVGMAVLSGGATYAAGQVFIRHFEAGGTLQNFDLATATRLYQQEFERGKELAQQWLDEQRGKKPAAEDKATAQTSTQVAPEDAFSKLEKLNELRQKGIITEADFNAKKQTLLDAI